MSYVIRLCAERVGARHDLDPRLLDVVLLILRALAERYPLTSRMRCTQLAVMLVVHRPTRLLLLCSVPTSLGYSALPKPGVGFSSCAQQPPTSRDMGSLLAHMLSAMQRNSTM